MSFSVIVDTLILLGAVAVAIINIYNFFAKPTSFLKKRKEEEFKERLEDSLKKLMPDILLNHDLETRKRYLSDRERYLKEISKEVQKNTEEDLHAIRRRAEEQAVIIDLLRKNTLDVLRQKIEKIYYDYRDSKKMPEYVMENLKELFQDYKAGGGNHHIDKLYNRMIQWETTDEIPEYDRD